jgi:ribosomal protein S27AE
MRSGICPKCRASAVYATNAPDSDFTLPTSETATFIGKATSNEKVATERYVCVQCGYFEIYVADRRLLGRIAASNAWIKV